MEPEIYWKILDQVRPEAYYSSETWNILLRLNAFYTTICNPEMLENIGKETRLLNRLIADSKEITDIWGWCLCHIGIPFRDWRTEDALYYQKRLLETQSPFQLARYAYAAFVFSDNDVELAIFAISNFMKTASIYIEQEWYIEYPNILPIVGGLALGLSLQVMPDEPNGPVTVLKSIIDYLTLIQEQKSDHIDIIDLIHNVRVVLDQILLSSKNKLHEEIVLLVHKIIEIINTQILNHSENENLSVKRRFLRELQLYQKILNISSKDATKQIAETYEKQAAGESTLIAEAVFLECAFSFYNIIKSQEKTRELRSKINAKLTDSFESGELDQPSNLGLAIKAIADVRIETLLLEKNLSIQDLAQYSIWPNLDRISLELTKKWDTRPKKVPHIIIERKELYKKVLSKKQEIFEYRRNTRFLYEAKVTELIVFELLEMLFDNFISSEKILTFLDESNIIIDEDYTLLLHLFRNYMQENYKLVVTIGLPILSHLLDQILKMHKQKTNVSMKEKGERLLTFDEKLEKCQPYLPSGLYGYLAARYSQLGSNFFELFSNGIGPSDNLNAIAAAMILAIIQVIGGY